MARLQRRHFDTSDDIRQIPNGRIEVVELGDRVIGRIRYEPGWRWSIDVKPIAGTQSCQFHHVGFTASGRLRVQMQEGIELEIGPGEVFEIPPGHDAWVVGDEPWVSIDFEAMRAYARSEPSSGQPVLASILISDIVESTARAVALGPARWRDVLGRHNEIAERVIDQGGGRLVKTTCDGAIGIFDSAERAVRTALRLTGAMAALQLEIRAGVHTGEVQLADGDVRGLAVHTAARVVETAGHGEVVVSSTVRDLLESTDLEFEAHGEHQLKGLPGERRLFHVIGGRSRSARVPASAD
ncbi:MAG TPA: adenylate/guanylate cyclase domain-containing protein [Candidatus Limnocylindrales bacterium]|nr:adenylate/guanylate cyclase domain-containing protein [Candidatus Limnocylindrales bacterium]